MPLGESPKEGRPEDRASRGILRPLNPPVVLDQRSLASSLLIRSCWDSSSVSEIAFS
jgi:hypothetical protein